MCLCVLTAVISSLDTSGGMLRINKEVVRWRGRGFAGASFSLSFPRSLRRSNTHIHVHTFKNKYVLNTVQEEIKLFLIFKNT